MNKYEMALWSLLSQKFAWHVLTVSPGLPGSRNQANVTYTQEMEAGDDGRPQTAACLTLVKWGRWKERLLGGYTNLEMVRVEKFDREIKM